MKNIYKSSFVTKDIIKFVWQEKPNHKQDPKVVVTQSLSSPKKELEILHKELKNNNKKEKNKKKDNHKQGPKVVITQSWSSPKKELEILHKEIEETETFPTGNAFVELHKAIGDHGGMEKAIGSVFEAQRAQDLEKKRKETQNFLDECEKLVLDEALEKDIKGKINVITIKGERYGAFADQLAEENCELDLFDRMKEACIQESQRGVSPDIIILPEYSFHCSKYPLEINTETYEIKSGTHPVAKKTIEKYQNLAREYKTAILLGGFFEEKTDKGGPQYPKNWSRFEDMIHIYINKDGEIFGHCRKHILKENGEVDKTDFIFEKDGKNYRGLPLVCGEAWSGEITEKIITSLEKKQETQEEKYDLLLCPMGQGDDSFEMVSKIRNGEFQPSERYLKYLSKYDKTLKSSYEWNEDAYDSYWGKFYTSLVKPDAPTIASDDGSGSGSILTPTPKKQTYINFNENYISSTVNIPKK